MIPLSPVFDVLLGLGLLWLAWRVVASRGRFTAVVLFMVFGLVMAIAWARLGAPDLALAEAAISAGITGALLLNACKAAYADPGHPQPGGPATPPPSPARRWLVYAICGGLGTALAATMAWLALGRPDVAPELRDAVSGHAVDNPVTVILLDFRGYDTLLEMAVLMMAFLGLRILMGHRDLAGLHPLPEGVPPMADSLVAMATPILLITALYLFWTGTEAPGGAFQAGALLGALGVMYRLTGRIETLDHTPTALRLGLILGLGVFAGFACLSLIWSDWPLSYPAMATAGVTLTIEFAMMISIAVTLTLLFSGSAGIRLARITVQRP